MRLNFKGQFIGAAAIFGSLLFTACTQEDQVKPSDSLPIEERGLISGLPVNTALIGLSTNNELVNLMSGPPVVDLGVIPITGLRVEEFILAIDTRPKTGELYGVSNQDAIYKIDKTTGAALLVSQSPLTPAPGGDYVAFDFSPAEDLIRLITNTGQNMRISPITGAVTSVDGPIQSFSVAFNGAAYTTAKIGVPGALYDLDPGTGALYRQNPVSGAISLVGLTGFNFEGDGGFEITTSNVAFAVQYGKSRFQVGGGGIFGTQDDTTQDAYRLLMINLRNGVATSHGKVRPMIGLAVK
jgi:hypothetical protein